MATPSTGKPSAGRDDLIEAAIRKCKPHTPDFGKAANTPETALVCESQDEMMEWLKANSVLWRLADVAEHRGADGSTGCIVVAGICMRFKGAYYSPPAKLKFYFRLSEAARISLRRQLDSAPSVASPAFKGLMLPLVQYCFNCDKKQTREHRLHDCQCGAAAYCNKECQKADWKRSDAGGRGHYYECEWRTADAEQKAKMQSQVKHNREQRTLKFGPVGEHKEEPKAAPSPPPPAQPPKGDTVTDASVPVPAPAPAVAPAEAVAAPIHKDEGKAEEKVMGKADEPELIFPDADFETRVAEIKAAAKSIRAFATPEAEIKREFFPVIPIESEGEIKLYTEKHGLIINRTMVGAIEGKKKITCFYTDKVTETNNHVDFQIDVVAAKAYKERTEAEHKRAHEHLTERMERNFNGGPLEPEAAVAEVSPSMKPATAAAPAEAKVEVPPSQSVPTASRTVAAAAAEAKTVPPRVDSAAMAKRRSEVEEAKRRLEREGAPDVEALMRAGRVPGLTKRNPILVENTDQVRAMVESFGMVVTNGLNREDETICINAMHKASGAYRCLWFRVQPATDKPKDI